MNSGHVLSIGPNLFLIYINHFPHSHTLGTTVLFADDAKILINPVLSQVDINKQLSNISSWCNRNKLALNYGTCKILRFTNRSKENKDDIYTIENNAISVVSHQNDLGIAITSNFTWSQHVM